MKDTFKVDNNGKIIGTVNVRQKNLENIAFLSFVLATITVGSIIVHDGVKKEEVVDNDPRTVREVINNDYRKFDIKYTVKEGDTLLSLLYTYESNPDKIEDLRKRTIELNVLPSSGMLTAGSEIMLFEVPEDKLKYFDYTTNYKDSVATKEDKLYDYIEYANAAVEKPKDGVENTVNYEIYSNSVGKLNSDYQNYLNDVKSNELNEQEREELFSDLYDTAIELDKEGYKLSNASFNDVERAYKLDL